MSWTYRHRKALIIAAIAVSVCLLAAAAIYSLIKQSEQEQKQQQMKEHYERQIEELKTIEEQSRRSVWTVAHAVPAGGIVKAEDLKSVPLPANLVPQGMITDQNAVIGKSAKIELEPGTPLMPSMLYEGAPIPKDLRVQEFQVIQLPPICKRDSTSTCESTSRLARILSCWRRRRRGSCPAMSSGWK